jgi:para-nitrobenzyl esterase
VVAPPPLAEGEKKGLSVATNFKAGSIKELRAIPAADLQKATGQGLQFLGPLLGVVVDGWVLPKPPFDIFQAGQQHKVDLLLGSNARELSRPFFPVAGLKQGIEAEFGPLAAQAMEHSRAGNRAYQFQFSRVPPGREAQGAAHGFEIPHVFGTLASAGRAKNGPAYNATDEAVSDQMQQYWTNFAKSGDPNGGTLPQWPQFDSAARGYLELTAEGPVSREGLRRAACDLWMENVTRR